LWSKPKNIGYPINSYDDDIGFFVSTDGRYGYFASNKFAGFGGWDLYSFDLYEEARPEKVLFIKGKLLDETNTGFKNTRVELRNVESKKITEIEVDTITGDYVGAVLFRNDFIMTVKRKGFVPESKYISKINPRFTKPLDMFVDLKLIEVGISYRLNDIYFDFNSVELKPESKIVIAEFSDFLTDNPTLKVSIQGHTDNIGNGNDNLILSENRAKAVYEYLIKLGIIKSRLDYKGFGESKPIESNRTEDGRARNRRTEFVIIEK
jgi:outer membrane protein OmpA-like peptidoglycan-associated protein